MNRQLTTSAPAQSYEIARGVTVTVAPGAKLSRSMAPFIGLTFAAHPKSVEIVDDMTLAAYDVILRNYPPEVVKAATQETLARVTWFPKVQEVAEAARYLMALITSRGMYAKDKESRERIEKIRAWERDILEDTRDFIERAKSERLLRDEIAAFARRREVQA